MTVYSYLLTVYFQEPYIWPQIHLFIFKYKPNIGFNTISETKVLMSKCSIENDEHSLSLIDVLDSIDTQIAQILKKMNL